jgi:GNAT superfamily N-acetyltransferase
MMMLETFNLSNPEHIAAGAQLWSAACGPDLAISERFVAYNVAPQTGKCQAGQLAVVDGQPAGFVLASVLKGDLVASPPEHGHIDALAVLPSAQHCGIGGALLAWAENWLRSQDCNYVTLGASMQPFTPGVPDELGTAPFFVQHGYQQNPDYGEVWDMTADLRDYVTPSSGSKASGVVVRPAQAGDEEALLGFLRREFPGGWRYECEELLRAGVRPSDYVLLLSERGVDGCCLVTFEDSLRPLDRFYMHRLPHPWGQLGAIGVSADRRGLGYGGALLDGGLRHLRDHGVRGCIIDWLVLVDFYAKFGFRTYRKYVMLSKSLAPLT